MPKGIYQRTEYHNEINRKGHLGKVASDKTKEKMSKSQQGKIISDKQREQIRQSKLGNRNPMKKKENALKVSLALTGRKCPEHSKRMKGRWSKEKNPAWKGGITDENDLARVTTEYFQWRLEVFARDNWTCQKYLTKGGKLEAHHIENFSNNKELRYLVSNGITFSEQAHKEFHKIYGKKNNTLEQVLEFIEGVSPSTQ
ncbi:MAG: hypothetical protein WC511_07075 [Candidatus Pacearchaeota archaeon]